MKIIASILAVLVLFLSTQSMMIHNVVVSKEMKTTRSCCTHKHSCKKPGKKENDNGCNGTCNPFMMCSGCMYDLIEPHDLSITPVPDPSVKNGYKPVYFISDYMSSLWHPPEFI